MCFSARIKSLYDDYVRKYGGTMDYDSFLRLYNQKERDWRTKTPRAMDGWFAHPQSPVEQEIKASIDRIREGESTRLEQELFKQRARLVEAERKLQTKVTKAASEAQRIANQKIKWSAGKLADLRRSSLEPNDARIYPGHYAPVMIAQGDKRVIVPMRYQCRPAGKPAVYDTKYPGTYNARRDNLEGFWKKLFGYRHGVMLVTAFFENVARHKVEGRKLAEGETEENVVLEFDPRPQQDMLVACLWSHWTMPGEQDLFSFAAITDEPPPEIAAAGHDRCIIPIKSENIDEWLNPDPKDLSRQYQILDDRERPYYEHRMAA